MFNVGASRSAKGGGKGEQRCLISRGPRPLYSVSAPDFTLAANSWLVARGFWIRHGTVYSCVWSNDHEQGWKFTEQNLARGRLFLLLSYISSRSLQTNSRRRHALLTHMRTYSSAHMPRGAKSVVLCRPGTVLYLAPAGAHLSIFILYCRARSKRRLSSRFTHFVSRHFENEKGCRGDISYSSRDLRLRYR